MSEIMLLVRNKDRKTVIKALADAKAVHLIDHEPEQVGKTTVGIGSSLPGADELSDGLTKARYLLGKLSGDAVEEPFPEQITPVLQRTEELAEAYGEHEERLRKIARQRELLAEQRRLLGMLADFKDPIETLFRVKRITPVLVEDPKDATILMRGETASLIALENEEEKEHYNVIDISPLENVHGTVQVALHTLHTRERVLDVQAEREQHFLASFNQHLSFLQHAESILAEELLKAQAPLHFGTTKHVTLIKGYIPTERIKEFQNSLDVDVVMQTSEAETAPTSMQHAPGVKNFEALMRLYSLPRYREVDPTSLMAFTFPFFFGFMLGDIGYGLVLLGLFLWIRHEWPSTLQFSNIIIISAISSIIFGLMYGEIFGLEVLFGYHLPHLYSRVHDINFLMIASIVFGVIHINIGLAFGFYNELRHGIIPALFKKGSWVLLQVAIVFMAAAYGYAPFAVSKLAAYSTLLISIAGIVAGEGVQGVFELPMIISHTLSYIRLAAIGLASVSLAFVINDVGAGFVSRGGWWVFAALAIILFGHTINIALGLLGPFLHSLRLHYAEFFMKFYEGGGIEYRPFGGKTW